MSHSDETEIAKVMALLEGYQAGCLMIAAVRLGLFEALRQGAKGVDACAEELGADPESLLRLSRGLAALGLLTVEDSLLNLTREGEVLLEGRSIVPTWALMTGEEFLPAWSTLEKAVVSGKPSFDTTFGMNVWEHRRRHPELARAFNQSMAAIQKSLLESFLSEYTLGGTEDLVDVGGGCGTWLSGILAAYPDIQGVLFDQEHVIEEARESVASTERLRLAGGSFLDSVPSGDVLILKSVLHNWNDEDCLRILGNCHHALNPGGKLLIIESPLPEDRSSNGTRLAMFDIHMMVMFGGKERSLEEYEKLAQKGGFRLVRVVDLKQRGTCVLEFVAVQQ